MSRASFLRLRSRPWVHLNTLLMQQDLAYEKWAEILTDAARRGLPPLFRTYINPYLDEFRVRDRLNCRTTLTIFSSARVGTERV